MGMIRTFFHYSTLGVVDSNSEARRKNTPFSFPHGMSEYDFSEISISVANQFKRLSVSVDNQFVYGTVCTQSGLNTWDFSIDFNDYGTITGKYWFQYIENTDSQIPDAFAKQLSEAIVRYLAGESSTSERECYVNKSDNLDDADTKTRLVLAKCTNCAANLEVDIKKEIAKCPYCGAQYIVENAINDYKNSYGKIDFIIRGGELKAYRGLPKDVVIPDNITVIGSNAFRGQAITSVNIPDSVIDIKENAFRDCRALEKINLPSSLVEIGVNLFRNCQSLKEITLPSTVVKIGVYAFRDCNSLKEITIPDSVEEIAPNAFWADKDLKITWSDKWNKLQTWKMQIAAHSLSEEIRVYVRNINNAPYITLFYCGRDPKGNYFFCERRNFYEQFNKRNTITEEFDVHDVVTRKVQDLYNDLVALLDKASISRDIIRKVQIPYDGWIPELKLGDKKGDLLEVLLLQLDDSGDPDLTE